MSMASILWGVVFGSIGLGFFVYGKKQGAVVPLVCGVALMVVPYAIADTVWMVVVSTALCAVPYFVRL